MVNSKIIGCGHYLPKKILKNDDFKEFIDTSDEWIFTRTGIKQRHIASEKQYTSDLAVQAAKIAIKNANIDKNEIDCIIIATTTPDETFPSTATKVQNYFKMKNIPSFDIQAVCSGFIYSLQIADSLIKAGNARKILVVGAETLSKIVDWKDRRTCVLFGDGAGAVILESTTEKRGLLSTKLFSDGSWHDSLFADGGPSKNQKVGKIRMNGQDIFKQAVNKLAEATELSLQECKLSISDIDWFIPHQANQRIISSTAKKIGIDESKTVSTVRNHANTSAASIPLALSTSIHAGIIKRDDKIAMCAIGGGLTWGSCILKF
ncbi:MAG: 3-oxoacyl-[acyl-carrier-protein] synthase 3 [Alphaproteobacteria bacterium MarineAlpha8_Bin1]|nr:MAG: 3-oxoacyl-[acyl-carrier-protein] synthase 3 [Alphaproteobacteria bacterium MarineAlpha8_Bin1]